MCFNNRKDEIMGNKVKNLGKYEVWMLCSYILSILVVFLPLVGYEGKNESLFDVLKFSADDLGLAGSFAGDSLKGIVYLKMIVVMLIIFSIVGIIMFIADVGGDIKYGIAVLMGVFASNIFALLEIGCSVVSATQEVNIAKIGLHLGMIAYIFQIIFPLVYLCILRIIENNEDPVVIPPVLENISRVISSDKGGLTVLRGENAGMEIPLEDGNNLILGRNSTECNLVVMGPKVSRKHCVVSYDAGRRMYSLKDYSSNGTYFANGVRLEPLTVVWAKPGTEFYLGNKDNVFRLK